MTNEERQKLDSEQKQLRWKAEDLNEIANFLECTNFGYRALAMEVLRKEAVLLSDRANYILKDLLAK